MLIEPPAPRRRRRISATAAALGIAVVVVSGCSARAATVSPTPSKGASSVATATPSAPDSGSASAGAALASAMASLTALPPVALSTYGVRHGPSGFRLPAGLKVVETIDQPNVVTLVMGPAVGPALAAWLRDQLPAQGYEVDGSSADSVVFSGPEWSGSFTTTDQLAGFTLRRNT